MVDPLVSIVVVAHSQEKDLVEALDSIRRQTIGVDKIEVVMVEDASDDSTFEIMEQYSKKYFTNFFLRQVHFRNVGKVRQFAMELVSAPYVMFLDGDDVLADTACEVLLQQAVNFSADYVVSPLRNFTGQLSPAQEKCSAANGKLVSRDDMISMLLEHRTYKGHLAGCLFNSSILKSVDFGGLACYEDFKVAPSIINRSKKIILMDMHFYHYRQRLGSTSKNIDDNKAAIMVDILDELGQLVLSERQRMLYCGLLVRQCTILFDNASGLSVETTKKMKCLLLGIPVAKYIFSFHVRVSLKRKFFQILHKGMFL